MCNRRYSVSCALVLACIAVLARAGSCLAEDSSCPMMKENLKLLQESETRGVARRNAELQPQRPHLLHIGPDVNYRDDRLSSPVRDVTYLSAPIFDIGSIKAAEAEALQWQKKGQIGFAATIRSRVQEACSERFGVPLSPAKFECVSMAEQLKERAWVCEGGEDYDMAERLYQRVIEIYQSEIGSKGRTAAAMADLSRVYGKTGNVEKARAEYANTLKFYDDQHSIDSDFASFLEGYAGYMDGLGEKELAQTLYQRAVAVRKSREFKQSLW